jgi:hypothetical protein
MLNAGRGSISDYVKSEAGFPSFGDAPPHRDERRTCSRTRAEPAILPFALIKVQ